MNPGRLRHHLFCELAWCLNWSIEVLTSNLGEEGDDIEPYKDLGNLDSFDAPYLLLRKKEVDHASQNHVDEGVDPYRSDQDEDLGDGLKSSALLVFGSCDAYGETGKFP